MINRRRTTGDDGATLVIVLILVTVIAVVLGTILAEADTGARSTVALGDQAASQYATDGAGQAAVSQLSQGTFPANCATPTGTSENLGSAGSPFYVVPGSGSTSYNATVKCAPDTGSGAGVTITDANRPKYALLTRSTAASPDGQTFGQANKDIYVTGGDVVSKSKINSNKATLNVDSTSAIRTVLGCTGTFSKPCTTVTAASITDTVYTPPTTTVATAPAPVCNTVGGKTIAAFRPGLYNSVAILNSPCASVDLEWFSPGTYYFDFKNPGQHAWDIPAEVFGGTPMNNASPSRVITQADPANAASLSALSQLHSMPGECGDPRSVPLPGVEFVFGGDSTVGLSSNSMELCATYSATRTPIAMYGLASALTGQGLTVAAQSGCIVAADPCSMITTPSNGHPEFHLNGLFYAPVASLDITFKNSPGQTFNWGLIAWTFSVDTVGTTIQNPLVELPGGGGVATSFSVMYVSVWLCAASATPCPTTDAGGNPLPAQLRAKVQVTGTGQPATVKVLSWNEIR